MNAKQILMTTAMAVAATAANAGHNETTDYATVTNVQPVYESVAHTEPQEQCWTETVRYEEPLPQRRSATGAILGTMIGAAVGHNVAQSKHGQRVGRVAGAILGASIANDIANRQPSGPARVEYRDEQRCEVQQITRYEQVVAGYDVSYEYLGRTYHTRMDSHPGNRIRVVVDVRPVY